MLLPQLLLLVLLPCALSNTCQEFFSYGTGTTDNEVADDRLHRSVNFDSTIRSGCGALNRLNISIGGRLSLSLLGQDNPIVTFKVFDVDPLDVESHNVYYRDVTNDQAIISCMEDLYEENFPRLHRTSSFTPTDILVATWEIRTAVVNSSALNRFQLLVGSGGNRSLVLYLYDTMEWNGANNNYAAVSLETCKNTWTNRDSQTSIIHTTMRYDSTIPGRQGEWVFFIDETGRVSEGVICRTGCSLVTGSCTIEDTCDCATGYSGSTCNEPICSSGCNVNGNCMSPGNCVCTNPALWSGDACHIPACPTECTQYNNGHCTVPNTCVCNEGWSDPSNNCQTAVCTSAECVPGNGVCSLPKTCFCYPEWTGSSCNTAICSSGCVNGQCISPDNCNCTALWSGAACDVPVCPTECTQYNNGRCSAPNLCVCSEGWTDPDNNCQTAVCDPPCINGQCHLPNTCSCFFGWTGPTCETQRNDCTPAACEAEALHFICQSIVLRNMTIPSRCIEYF